jgi:ParB-like chromosome segregation protein Spo0J
MDFDVDKKKWSWYSWTYSRAIVVLGHQTSLHPNVDSTEICSMQQNTEFDLPEGCEVLEGTNFCLIPFDLLALPDQVEYKGKCFTNPRNITEKSFADQTDQKTAKDLQDSIATHTLLNPLVCRFVEDKNGDPKVVVIGGERRYRAIYKLRDENVFVSTGKIQVVSHDGSWTCEKKPARVVYHKVPCQLFFCQTDKEAITLAWAENKNRKNLTDGVEIAQVKVFREKNLADLFIQETIQRDWEWLKTTDALINGLDEETYDSLINDKITRDCAIELLKQNEGDRKKILKKVSVIAQKRVEEAEEEVLNIIEEELSSAQDEFLEASYSSDDDFKKKASANLEVVKEKVDQVKFHQKLVKPVATAKDVKKVYGELAKRDVKVKSLKDKVNNQFVKYLEILILNKGADFKADFVIDPKFLEFALRLFRDNHLAGEKDYPSTIKNFVEWLDTCESEE